MKSNSCDSVINRSYDRSRVRRPLRIAMIAPPWFELPPVGYGGIEQSASVLIDALVARRHEVTLFGAGVRTGTAAKFVSTVELSPNDRMGDEVMWALHAARVDRLLAAGRFDVVHDHTISGALTAHARRIPTVVTAHNLTTGDLGDFYRVVSDSVSLVAISDSQRRSRPDLPWAATVHHAIDNVRGNAEAATDGPVLWLGRFCADKGPDLAIRACREAGVPLVLVGKCTHPDEIRYLDDVIRPMLGDDVRLVCNADRTTCQEELRRARCLIMPIRWHEPFGMVMIEAMAAGKPVVAMRMGSVGELIVDGVTGWICDDEAELPDALHRVSQLDTTACLNHTRVAFGPELMARRYEDVYRAAIARSARLTTASLGALSLRNPAAENRKPLRTEERLTAQVPGNGRRSGYGSAIATVVGDAD